MSLRRIPRSLLILPLAAALSGGGCECGSSSRGTDRGLAAAPPPPPPAASGAEGRGVTLATFATGLKEPVGLTFAPGDGRGRLFVVEKIGRIVILRGGEAAAEPFLDISARVSRGGEQGLLGLAFHPRYAENGRFFINYTDREGDTRIAEMRASSGDPDKADPGAERELLRIDQPYSNHNGGHLVIGPDGKLYIGMGDGGSRDDPKRNGQNKESLLGKMLRLDIDAPSPAPEIIQMGLRNPWRYSFDRKTGDLYIADVGQNRFEEVDVVPAGRIDGHNFGWNIVEGNGHCLFGEPCDKSGLTAPVIEYTSSEGCSITGGFVYRGRELPELDGLYFYADYCTALIRSFRFEGGRAADPRSWKAELDPKGKLSKLTAFGEDEAGELYLLSQDGPIYRFTRAR
jgi:glucose/arabinose dehydrogenase